MPKLERYARELADREAIRDCLARYCRGIDRHDPELVRSAYWPGAMDHHTGFTGTIEQFVEWAMPRLAAMESAVHLLGQCLIEIAGDVAKVETYRWSVSVRPGPTPTRLLATGRYADRFEKRDDEWRIAERFVIHDWYEEAPDGVDWAVGPMGLPNLLVGARKPQDKTYGWLGLP